MHYFVARHSFALLTLGYSYGFFPSLRSVARSETDRIANCHRHRGAAPRTAVEFASFFPSADHLARQSFRLARFSGSRSLRPASAEAVWSNRANEASVSASLGSDDERSTWTWTWTVRDRGQTPTVRRTSDTKSELASEGRKRQPLLRTLTTNALALSLRSEATNGRDSTRLASH